MWEIFEQASIAYGTAMELGLDNKHPVAKALLAAYDAAENAFCREDPDAYREWAMEMQQEGVEIEPCDAWYELDYRPWVDEPDPGPFESETWKRVSPEIFDQIGVESSSIYREGENEWKWERDAEVGSELPLQDGAERLSGGGLRMHFDSLAQAMDYAEKYQAALLSYDQL